MHVSTCTRITPSTAYTFHTKAVIYVKFEAVLQMKYFLLESAPAVFAVKCVVYGLNSSDKMARRSVVKKTTR